MPLKQILSIDIDAKPFKDFAAHFDKFRAQLKEMPNDWKNVGESMKALNANFGNYEDRVKALEATTRKMGDSPKEQGDEAERSASMWSRISVSTGTVASNINHATGNLLKWGTITGAFMGLIGAGSLFGIDRWASGIAASRRTALGLGISYGTQASLGINLSRFVDPASMLGNVNRAALDFTSPGFVALMNATGMSGQQLSGLNSAQLSLMVLQNLPRILGPNIMKTPGMLGPQMQTYGLTNFIGVEDAARYMNAKPEERAAIVKSAQGNIKNQELTAKAQVAWTNFSTQMQRASGRLEATFGEALKALAGPLKQVSDALVGAVARVVRSDEFKEWVKLAGDGLERLAKYIDTPQFEKDVADWVKSISDFIHSFVDMMGGFADVAAALGKVTTDILNYLSGDSNWRHANGLDKQWQDYQSQMTGTRGGAPGGVGQVGKWWTPDKIKEAVSYLEKKGFTHEGAVAAVATMSTIEAPGGPASVNPSSGAYGLGQWLGPRKPGIAGNTDFHDQLDYLVKEARGEINYDPRNVKAGKILMTSHDLRETSDGMAAFERGGYGGGAVLPGAQRIQKIVDDDADSARRKSAAEREAIMHPVRQALRFRNPKLRVSLQPHDNPALAAAQAGANSYPVSGASAQ